MHDRSLAEARLQGLAEQFQWSAAVQSADRPLRYYVSWDHHLELWYTQPEQSQFVGFDAERSKITLYRRGVAVRVIHVRDADPAAQLAQVEEWMMTYGQPSGRSTLRVAPAVPVGITPRQEVIDWIADRSEELWPYPPNGYPRVHTDKLGRRAQKKVRRLLDTGTLPQRPPARALRFYEYGPGGVPVKEVGIAAGLGAAATFTTTAVFALEPPLMVIDSVAGMAAGAMLWFFIARNGLHGPLMRKVGELTGNRWDRDAVEYVPWAHAKIATAAPLAAAASSLRARRLALRSPSDRVGQDCAILLVAELICESMTKHYVTLSAGAVLAAEHIDTDRELHEIAWSVTDLRAHSAERDGEHPMIAQDRAQAVAALREALIDRVTALYVRERELAAQAQLVQAAATDTLDREHQRWLETSPQEMPDLSGILGAPWIHKAAADRLAPGTATWEEDRPTVQSGVQEPPNRAGQPGQ